MGHYDEDVHCRKCGEYLGTYYMLLHSIDKEDEYCKDKKKCKERQRGKRKIRYW